MINIEYTTTPQETSQATLDFLSNRPLVAMLFTVMRITCVLLIIGFAAMVYNKSARPQDIVSLITAFIWIVYYKKINRWVIKSALKARRFNDAKYHLKIDEQSILCRFDANNLQYIEWKKLRYILNNKEGYIIPLTGFANAGKFLWLPMRGFTSPAIEQEFLGLVSKFKLKIKALKT